MKDLIPKVYEIICNHCGSSFDHPGSCEECLDDAQMNDLREYAIKIAKDNPTNYEEIVFGY